MNSYERVVTTLKGEIPDRVPTFELLIDPLVSQGIIGHDDYMDLADYVDLDVVLTTTPSKLYREKVIDPLTHTVVNEWGVVRRYNEEVVSIPVEGPIKNPEDIDSYQTPDPLDDYRYESLKALIKRFKGKRFVGMHLHDAFNYPFYLRGMEVLFMDMFENPDIVHKLVKLSVEHNIAMAEKAIDLGADFIILGDDYGSQASTLFSPNHFREFFLPGLREIVQAVKAKGAYCFKHCCGNINAILPEMLSIGLDAIHPLDGNSGMDMAAVKADYQGVTIIGGVNCGAPLSKFSVTELESEVKRVLSVNAPGGRYILASSNSIHSDVKPENFLAMQKSVQEFGKYQDNGELLWR